MRPEISPDLIQRFSPDSFLPSKLLIVLVMLLMLSFFPSHSAAHQFSVGECKEGSDFIRNAALARDNGMAEESFIDRVSDDIEVIRAFPPALRWFVQDGDDAKFLLSAAANVFQHPKPARAHQADFFNECIASTKATSSLRRFGSM
ncbi:MAG: hypothetical protein ACXU7D_10875 [Burkholderiaceae bacterium]